MEHGERGELSMKELILTVLPHSVWPGEQAWTATRRPKTARMEEVNCILTWWIGVIGNACGCCIIVVVVVDEEAREKRTGEEGLIYLDPVAVGLSVPGGLRTTFPHLLKTAIMLALCFAVHEEYPGNGVRTKIS
jgi:hypothetical protein